MMEKVIKLIEDKNMIIPYILFSQYSELNISDEELIVLMYLINDSSKIYNPKKMSEVLKKPISKILELTNELTEKDLLQLEVKIENNVHIEYVSLDNLYQKLAFLVINEQVEEEINTNIYDNFEKEIGRPLSPI